MDTAEMLRGCEEKFFQVSVRKNAEAVSAMLADGFQEFGGSGRVYSKDQVIAALQSEHSLQITMEKFQARLLTDEVALITYRSRRRDQVGSTTESLRSSIWIFQSGEWRMVFHQGTKTPAEPAK
jgi:hypothetical protein